LEKDWTPWPRISSTYFQNLGKAVSLSCTKGVLASKIQDQIVYITKVLNSALKVSDHYPLVGLENFTMKVYAKNIYQPSIISSLTKSCQSIKTFHYLWPVFFFMHHWRSEHIFIRCITSNFLGWDLGLFYVFFYQPRVKGWCLVLNHWSFNP